MDFLQGLNPQQQDAVSHVDGPLLILAGAGSGKTRVITHRIAHLVRSHRVPGPAVLAVTFTNKAADEMRERVAKLLGDPSPGSRPMLSTFHSFCVRLLRRDGSPLASLRPGFTPAFTIYDEDEQLALVKSIYRNVGLDEKFMQYRAAISRISHAKNHQQTPADFYRQSTDPKTSKLAVVFEQYESRLRQANALDFDDLLLEAVRLLHHDQTTRDLYNRRFEHLMIDEYQDTNRSQYQLMQLLTVRHQNVCVVGDEDQSIYGWRGADIRNILDFEKDYPKARVIRLEQNYRSTKNILESAGAVVAHNLERKGKTLWTEAHSGAKIGLYEAPDAENEALFIADSIERLLAQDPADRVAVLYRTNFQSRQIEEALRRYGRKYLVVGGFSFYQRAEVKDLLAYLKAVASPQDSINLLRIVNTPARGIGKTTVEAVERYALERSLPIWEASGQMMGEKALGARAEAALGAFRALMERLRAEAEGKSVDAVLRAILNESGYRRMLETDPSPEAESRLENINELLNAAAEAAERGEGITEFLDHAALVADADGLDEHAAVSLLTLHNAKGLEFPVVFVAGLEEGLFPHSRSLNAESMLEEERRLCYVGMTRARKRLFLTWARARRRFGGGDLEPSVASRFLKEVPARLTENLSPESRGRQVDLAAERWEVREAAKRNTFTGKTYNSLENIAQFFAERGVAAPRPPAPAPIEPPAPAAPKPVAAPAAAKKTRGCAAGAAVRHPRYGRGTVLRREGEGDDLKLTISFPGYGLKKLIAKFAGIQAEE
ncbi:MAG: UvrD-helicase domain-containing protein [Acidobacteria bacterium]|nr:UvrD-helicase domain-containing protein [Acidobacteriota bacterium]